MNPTTEFMVRSFLTDLAHSYEDSWVSARVDALEECFGGGYRVDGQFALSDGGHTAEFYVTGNEETIQKNIDSLEVIERTLHAFIDKLRQSADKLKVLNSNVTVNMEEGKPAADKLINAFRAFGDIVEGEPLVPDKLVQSDV